MKTYSIRQYAYKTNDKALRLVQLIIGRKSTNMTLIGIKDEISEDLFNSNFIETVDYRGNKDFMLTKHGFELLQGKMRKWERKEQVQKFIAKYFKDEAKSQVIVCPSIPAVPIEELEKSEPPIINESCSSNDTIYEQTNKEKYLDSREVAEMLGKKHKDLMRDINGDNSHKGILPILLSVNFTPSDYFLKSSYKDVSGKENNCYQISRMGCELLGNKLQGEKGIIFTAKYVKRFHDMEQKLNIVNSRASVDIVNTNIQMILNQNESILRHYGIR